MLDIQAGCFGGFFETLSRRKSSSTTFPKLRTDAGGDARPRISELEAKQYPVFYYDCHAFLSGQDSECSPTSEIPPPYSSKGLENMFSEEVAKTIDTELDKLEPSLRQLSLQIHDHPELGFEEKFAHDTLTMFMSSHGFSVTKHYLGLDTAWRADFTHAQGGRVLGINAEFDALPGNIGHGCGHNLIAMSGVGIALAVKKALQVHNMPGAVTLLGTPAEETGGGKIILLERGGYRDMDVCLMCHPTSGEARSVSLGSTLAMQIIDVEYFGRAAHAGGAPWEGTNALDAAFLAYSSVSVLRQQMKPDERVHGIITGKDWAANVIPDYAKMRWYIRAPNSVQLQVLRDRVKNCFEAGALATGCKMDIKFDLPYYELKQNSVLAAAFSEVVSDRYCLVSNRKFFGASTDFGNVTYDLPALHPCYTIPTPLNGNNHTAPFAKAARTMEAHNATMIVAKGLAIIGYRILNDDAFFKEVMAAYDDTMKQF